jgi:hypothetical protein
MIKEHHRQADFLQSLILLCEFDQASELLSRMGQARHEDRIMRVAVLLSILLGVLVLGAMGYAAVLAPETFLRSSTPLRLLQTIGTASFICMVVFLVYWSWKRTVCNDLHEECRHFVMRQLRIRLEVRFLEDPVLRPVGSTPKLATP